MGIRFDCPNGHRLNVKSFLAGKKGLCPHCGVKFRIPEASEANDDGSESDMGPPADDGKPVVAPMIGAPPVAATPRAKPQAGPVAVPTAAPIITPVRIASAVPTGVPVVTPVVPVVTPVAAAGQPANLAAAVRAAASTVAPAPAAGDPLAEAPTAIWYVRPPSGGQYGPARADVMRQWLGDGRVTPQSLVWREGWPDWRVAGDVFPSLGGGSPPVVANDAVPVDAGRSTRKTTQYLAKRKSSNTLAVGGIVILVLLVIGLIIALAVVLSGGKV